MSVRTNERVNGMPLSMASLGPTGRMAWQPNWIDYRSSVANIDRRQDRDDTAATCRECGCETDITPVPHSPKCPTLNPEEDAMEGRALLDMMDAGEPLTDDEETVISGDEPDEIEEREPEPDEAAVAGADDSASAEADSEPAEPSRSSTTTGTGRSKWTRETVIAAIRDVAEKVGRTPSGSDMRAHGYGGAYQVTTFDRLNATWRDLVAEAGYEPRVRGDNGKGSGREPQAAQARTVSPPGPTEPKAASRPDKPETPENTGELALNENAVRDPLATANIPYDADVLEDEARFLRGRAAALEQIAEGIRTLARLSEEHAEA